MKKMKLNLQQKFTQEEYEILEIMHQVLHKTQNNSIYSPWIKAFSPKETAMVIHHLLFSCRDFLGSIFTLMHDCGYHSTYIIGSSLVEYFIDFSFILSKQEDANSRAKEYFNAIKENRKPFSKDAKFKYIEKRANEAKLTDLYSKTYKSLCSFKHVNLKGYIVTCRDKRLNEDRKRFMLQMINLYLAMWQKLKDYLNNTFLNGINDLLNKELVKIEELIKQDLKS